MPQEDGGCVRLQTGATPRHEVTEVGCCVQGLSILLERTLGPPAHRWVNQAPQHSLRGVPGLPGPLYLFLGSQLHHVGTQKRVWERLGCRGPGAALCV